MRERGKGEGSVDSEQSRSQKYVDRSSIVSSCSSSCSKWLVVGQELFRFCHLSPSRPSLQQLGSSRDQSRMASVPSDSNHVSTNSLPAVKIS